MQLAHERTFSWTDFREVARNMAGRPHLDWMQAMIAGEIPPPPLGSAFEFTFETAEPGRVTFSVPAQAWAANPAGVLHGGFIATLLDTVLTLCVQTMLPPDRLATTTDLHVRYVRPATPNGQRLRAEANAVHVGSTLGTAEGKVFDAAGKLIAHGTTALAIIPMPGAR